MLELSSFIPKNHDALPNGEGGSHALLLQLPVAVALLSQPGWVVTFANDCLLRLAGKTREQITNRSVAQTLPVQEDELERLADAVQSSGRPFTVKERKVFFERGETLRAAWLDIVFQPVKSDGEAALLVVVTDVTDAVQLRLRKEEEEALLRKTGDQLALSINVGQIGVWHWDLRSDVVTWSKEQMAIYGLSEGEFSGRIEDFHRLVLPEDLPLIVRTAAAEKKADGDYEYRFRIRRKDGEVRWIQGRSRSFYNAAGEAEYRTGVNVDITERKKAEDALQQSEEKFRSTFDNAAVGIAHVDIDGHWQMVNDRLCDIVGYSREELLTTNFQDITHPEDLEKDLKFLQEVLQRKRTRYAIEKRYFHKSGRLVWVNLTVSLVRNAKGHPKYFISVVEDVTERKAADEKLLESEIRFRTLAETLPQLVWMMDVEGKIVYASKQWQEYSGIEDVHQAWNTMLHPDDRNGLVKAWDEAFANGGSFRHEVRLQNKDGEYRWHFSEAEPLVNEAGKVGKWIGALTDIHTQKTFSEKLEKEVAEQTKELQRSNEDLQQFAHVASHDLKEPIRKVRTFGSRLEEEYGNLLPEKAKMYLEKMQSSAERMSGLIDGVLNYSLINSLEGLVETVDLNEIFFAIESDLEVALQEKGGRICKHELPTVNGSTVLLNQLFYNLLNNALKFSKPGVPPAVTIAAETVEGRDIKELAGADAEKTFVQISVCDNGIGFKPEQAGKIFKTFTRLNSRDKYEGTGLGLALCKKIAERHGGHIYATGKEGKGACFYVLLPL